MRNLFASLVKDVCHDVEVDTHLQPLYLYYISDRGPFLIDLIKARGFHFTPAFHTRLGLGLICLKNWEKIMGLQPT